MPMLYRYSAGDLRNIALSFLRATDTRTLNLWRSILVLRQCKFIISFSLLLFMPMLYRCLAGDLCNVVLSFLGTTDTRTFNLWQSILVLQHCKFLISFSLFLFMPMVYSVWLVIHATLHCCFSELLTHVPSSVIKRSEFLFHRQTDKGQRQSRALLNMPRKYVFSKNEVSYFYSS